MPVGWLMVKGGLTFLSSLPNRPNSMTGRNLALLVPLALLAGAFAMPGTAAAQCRLCDTPLTERSAEGEARSVRIEVQARLDFDQLVLLDASAPGTARLLPDGTSSVSGALGAMSGRAMVGSVVIRGEPGRLVRIGLPGTIQLHGLAGGTIRVDSLTTDLPASPRLDSQGSLMFRFGGELHVGGSVEGDYRGDIPITVDYL
jgi:hypothetical protein